MSHNLPSKGTTSTNYGAPFGIYTTALLALRCCHQNREMSIMINNNKYNPWHDLVLNYQNQTICVLTTHESELKNKKKFKASLDQREMILKQHDRSLVFVRLGIAATDDRLKKQYQKVSVVPEALDLLLTTNSVYFDETGSTYFCTEQHDVPALETDIGNALLEFIGKDFITKAQLRKVQTIFLEFIENRFYRLIQPDSPMTVEEVRRHLSYIILGLFKVPCSTKSVGNKEVSGDLEQLLSTNVVVLNHRRKSIVKDNIWKFLAYKKDSLKHSVVDALWFSEKLHMPLLSLDENTDRAILRALQIVNFAAKVLVLRPRVFTFKKIGKILTILQNLPVNDTITLRFGSDEEVFKIVKLRPDELVADSVHLDLFCGLAQSFGCDDVFIETHDEFHYINEEVVLVKEPLTALIAAIKTPGVDPSVVEDLIKLGANVDTVVIGGHGPLYFAVQVNRPDIVEVLLRNGAKPDLADKYGNIPLFYACMEGKSQMVDLLLRYNSDRNAADYYGVAPMFMAYRAKNYEILKILLTGNKKPTAADVSGYHILHRAAIDGDVDCLKTIMESVPDLNVFMVGDAQGLTPLDIAREHKHKDFMDILEKALKIY